MTETTQHVRTAEDVERLISACFEAGWSTRVISRELNLPQEDVSKQVQALRLKKRFSAKLRGGEDGSTGNHEERK